jgi:hypothetical protein
MCYKLANGGDAPAVMVECIWWVRTRWTQISNNRNHETHACWHNALPLLVAAAAANVTPGKHLPAASVPANLV